MSTPAPSPSKVVVRFHRWHQIVLHLCLILFAAELAYCLILMPWQRAWSTYYIPMHAPKLSDLWMSPYFRGVISGLGLLNIYVAFAEAGRLIRLLINKPGNP
jgi:hypothetical protein